VRLEHSLVLNRYFHRLLGAPSTEGLKPVFTRVEEGPGPDGQSRFCHAIAVLKGLRLSEEKLREYVARIVGDERRLANARGGLAATYFPSLSLWCADISLDRSTEEPASLRRALNAFLVELRAQEIPGAEEQGWPALE
jgi:hypothetical protein